jgi:hypothetical protein
VLALALLTLALLAPADTTAADSTATGSTAAADSTDGEPEQVLSLGGAVRFNLLVERFDPVNQDKGGILAFDTFRAEANGSYGRLLYSAEYRFYAGFRMMHHGWVGYEVAGGPTVRVGVHQVPFGLQPYASNSWFFQLPYYVGLEDDYDAGLKLTYDPGPWRLDAAYYLNAEEMSFAGGTTAERYSFDVIPADTAALPGLRAPRTSQETNQFNGKVAYALGHAGGTTTVGVSGQWGQLYSQGLDDTGTHWAAAAHVHGTYGAWDLKLEAVRYVHDPALPNGADDDVVVMGAYNAPYLVANEGRLYLASLARTFEVDAGPVSSVKVYHDASHLDKGPAGFTNATSFITGALTQAGGLYVYADVLYTRNHPFSIPGANFTTALARGSNDWRLAFNMNIGYYF